MVWSVKSQSYSILLSTTISSKSSKVKFIILTNFRYNKEFDHSAVVEAADITNAKNFIESDELDRKKCITTTKVNDPEIEIESEKVSLNNRKKNKKDKENKEQEEEVEDGTGYERKVGMKGGKLSGGQK